MYTRGGDLVSLALQRSLSSSSSKKAKLSVIDENIVASARRVLSTKIEYIHCPQYSTSEFLKSLKSKYTVLKSNRLKKKKKKKNKHKNSEHFSNNRSPMKNTELNNGQNLSLPTPKVVLFSPDSVQLGWKGNVPVGSGFVNLGTTCYINSTLQALFHVPSFVNWLLDDRKHLNACQTMNGMMHTECLVCSMSKTLFMSHRNCGSNIRPKYIIDKVKTICKHLSPYRQEDAHEFLRYLMEAMEKSYTAPLGIQAKKLDNFSKETTPLNQIFGGYIRTEVTCLECSHISTTFQHFQDLILDIRQSNTTSVYDGLESYFSKERLDGDEAYHCEHCKKKVSAYKKFTIERAPNALCIQLKRFNINSFYGGSKISKLISTPQTIDLSKFKHKKGSSGNVPLKYRLVSMVFHHGPSANSGHYTALGCTSTGSYYYFNDEQVYSAHLGNYTNNPNAYIIFYELEKPCGIEYSDYGVKSSANHSVSTLSNGCTNGTVQQRTNGFFPKRENSFLSSSNHTKPPPLVLVENKSSPAKPVPAAASIIPSVVKSTPTSLVPYTHSSDSEDSDVENCKPVDSNNNNNNADNSSKSGEENDKNGVTGPSALSPLAKKNSTLTSLLSSSPKNESPSYRVTSSAGSLGNSKPLRLDSLNGIENEEPAHPTTNGIIKPEKRNMISFSLINKKKTESPIKIEETAKNGDDKSKPTPVSGTSNGASISSYISNGTNGCSMKKEPGDHEPVRNSSNLSNGHCTENGVNGSAKPNGMVNGLNGSSATATNGWTVTEMEDGDSPNGEKNQSSKSARGDWVVTEKENRKSLSLSPCKESKSKDSRRFNGNNNDLRNEMSSENYSHSQNYTNSYSYSSHNGYGGKVLAWNGDLSRINKESEQERKELGKRSYNSYDDEIDRGKIKKARFNRNENNSNFQPSRKNLIQQQQNDFNRKRWQFQQNNGYHQYNNNNRRYPHNTHFKNNNNNNNNYYYGGRRNGQSHNSQQNGYNSRR